MSINPLAGKVLCDSRTLRYSLVDPGIVLPLAREAEHATDDSAVLHAPGRVADLLPLAAVLHLHIALRHRDALTVGREDGPNPYVLHLDVQILGEETTIRITSQSINLSNGGIEETPTPRDLV